MKKKKWLIDVFIMTFVLSIIFSYITNILSLNNSIVIISIIILFVIAIGIFFDMIGTSSLTANEATLHAMASEKIKGAKTAIRLIKSNVRVSSICNDIIGDVCGVISGGLGAILAILISSHFNINITISTMLVAAFISSLTVGGKAIFKVVAYKNADKIIFKVGKFVSILKKEK